MTEGASYPYDCRVGVVWESAGRRVNRRAGGPFQIEVLTARRPVASFVLALRSSSHPFDLYRVSTPRCDARRPRADLVEEVRIAESFIEQVNVGAKSESRISMSEPLLDLLDVLAARERARTRRARTTH